MEFRPRDEVMRLGRLQVILKDLPYADDFFLEAKGSNCIELGLGRETELDT